jgi:subtilisin family serine protease
MPSHGTGFRFRRTLQLTLTAMLATLVVAGAAASGEQRFEATPLEPDSTFTGVKSASGYLAQTDPSLLGRTDSARVSVLVKYDIDPTSSYDGRVPGLDATSPAVTGKPLRANRAAVEAYERFAGRVTDRISAAVERAVPSADVGRTFITAYGGVSARVPANAVSALLAVDGVVAVQRDSIERPQTDATPQFIGAAGVWPSLGGADRAGAGVTVGVLDTGIWPEHPSFRDTGLPAPGRSYGCEFGNGSDIAHLGPTFACNKKLVGAYAFTDTYMAVLGAEPGEYCNNATGECSARDSDGHGTHTASTAAGDRVASAPIFGIERGPIGGIAPGARVVMYRVCLDQGCFQSDSIAAIQQAIVDDVDVINFSISGGSNPYSDAVELAFLDAFHAGISVNASAGNSGPDAGTVNHGGPWVTTVGASTSNRFFRTTLRLSASNGDTFELAGVTITPGIAPTPVVLPTSIPGGDALCVNPLPAGSAAGKIVACRRGPNRVLKSENVKNAGGAGMILYNPIKQDVLTDNHWVPTIHVDGPSGPLLAFLTGHSGVTGSWATGAKTAVRGNVMAQFSSRGPQADFVKPDITAPGVQILAGHTPTPATAFGGPPGELFQAIAGTSMSGPHAAGASALVKAAHPDWTPAMIKSALMTSATQDALKDDGLTPADPFDAGAGALNVARAVSPTLVFDETFESFVSSAADPLHRINLNIPSVDAPTMTGQITTKRTAINVSGKDQDLEIETTAPAGAEIIVSDKAPGPKGPGKGDKKLRAHKGKPLDFWITIAAPALPDGQYFGRITLDPKKKDANEVTIPVAFFKRQGAVTLTHTCAPLTFREKTGSSSCLASVTNFSTSPAVTSLTVTNLDKGNGLDFKNVQAPATAIKKDDGVQWSGTLTPVVPPQVTAIQPTTGPAGGYLPLSLFGVAPIAGVGDDTITNFNVPAFMYGGEAYTRVGVVSNGYVVLGGGTAEDIVFLPQTFPNPARPNNVIAPWWTDLDPSAGGAIRIATLTDGVSTWLVVDWAGVRNFSNPTTHSFEIWLRLGTTPASEQITISYGTNGAGDPGSGSNWGAENRDGSSGKNIPSQPANGSEWAVLLDPPLAGGSASILYDVTAKKAGTYRSVAGLTSNVTPGITQVVQTFTVTKP